MSATADNTVLEIKNLKASPFSDTQNVRQNGGFKGEKSIRSIINFLTGVIRSYYHQAMLCK